MGAGITMRVPLTPTSAGRVRGAGSRLLEALQKLGGRTPTTSQLRPLLYAGPGLGGPRGRGSGGGEGTTGWTGSGKGWRPPPTPAEAPRGWRRGWGQPGPSLPLRLSGTPAAPDFPTARRLGGAAFKGEV